MSPARRITAMLSDPAAEWAKIETETGDPAFVLSHYVAWLALIPAVFSFIGACVIGVVAPSGMIQRASLFDGVSGAVFGYVMTCAAVLALALLIDLAAPAFGGRRDFDSAFRLAVYAFTPAWLAGIFLLLPGLHFLVLTGFYGAYLCWLGLPRLMKAPPQRALDFTALIAIVAFALVYIAATLQHMVFGTPGL
jgi:Yip1 domain